MANNYCHDCWSHCLIDGSACRQCLLTYFRSLPHFPAGFRWSSTIIEIHCPILFWTKATFILKVIISWNPELDCQALALWIYLARWVWSAPSYSQIACSFNTEKVLTVKWFLPLSTANHTNTPFRIPIVFHTSLPRFIVKWFEFSPCFRKYYIIFLFSRLKIECERNSQK